MTLNGFDVSGNNPASDASRPCDFLIVKASEGVTFVDAAHDRSVATARSAGRLVGHYHYAHPESNAPDVEASAFLRSAKAQPGDVLALDFEPAQIGAGYVAWVLTFAQTVLTATGVLPWLYTNDSQGKALNAQSTPAQKAPLHRMPLWKAYYQPTPGDLMGWPAVTCWQWSGSGVDSDTFYGDATLWRALGVPNLGDNMADAVTQATLARIEALASQAATQSANANSNAGEARRLAAVALGAAQPATSSEGSLQSRIAALEAAVKGLTLTGTVSLAQKP